MVHETSRNCSTTHPPYLVLLTMPHPIQAHTFTHIHTHIHTHTHTHTACTTNIVYNLTPTSQFSIECRLYYNNNYILFQLSHYQCDQIAFSHTWEQVVDLPWCGMRPSPPDCCGPSVHRLSRTSPSPAERSCSVCSDSPSCVQNNDIVVLSR